MNDNDTPIPKPLTDYHISASPELDARIHRAIATAPAPTDEAPSGPSRLWRYAGKMAVAAALAWLLLSGRQPKSIVWADVVDRFASADFVHVSLYLADSRSHSPVQVQLWLDPEGNAKLQCFDQVVWTQQGQILAIREGDRDTSGPIHSAIETVLEQLPTHGAMSLDALIQLLSRGQVSEITHTLALEDSIARDLAVFEGPSSLGEGQVRLYALRESQLPIGFRLTIPSSGACYEAFLTYPLNPDKTFFDPNTL